MHFSVINLASGGKNFNDFPENQLIKLSLISYWFDGGPPKKTLLKSLGVSKKVEGSPRKLGGPDPPTPSGCALGARACLVVLALKNHADGDFIARGAWWSNTRSIRPAI